MTAILASTPGSDRLRENPEFRRLFLAGVAAKFGTHVSYVAVPLVAVEVLDASAGEVGALAAASTAASLLLGLPAGAWVDRARKRRLMIAADLVRALLLVSVPVAWWLGALTIGQLYAVVFLAGVGTVLFDVAHQSLLPSIVDRDRLTGANGRLVALESGMNVAGRGAAGFLVSALGAPLAMAADAFGYVWSALFLRRMRTEPPPAGAREPLVAEIRAGVRFVRSRPALRALLAAGAVNNCSLQMFLTMLPLVWLRADLPAFGLGLLLGAGGAGVFAGAAIAGRLRARLGTGRSLWVVGALVAPLALVLPLVGPGWRVWAVGAAWAAVTAVVGVANVVGMSLRQQATPEGLLGRMNAVFRFVFMGAVTVGAAAAGLIGELVSPDAVLWIGAAGIAVQWTVVFAARRHFGRD